MEYNCCKLLILHLYGIGHLCQMYPNRSHNNLFNLLFMTLIIKISEILTKITLIYFNTNFHLKNFF